MARDPNCQLCGLCESSKNVCIWGHGSGDGFVVGEGPGKEEGRTGKVFQGRAGQLGRPVLAEYGIIDPYITNAVKCRPPQNRKPEPSELKICKPYLLEEIAERQPKAILLWGATAMKTCLGRTGITEMNGQIVEKDGQTYVCCFHPAAVLRDPSKMDDFRMAVSRYGEVLRGEFSGTIPKWQPIEASTFDEFIADWLKATGIAFDVETAGEEEGEGLKWWLPEFDITTISFSLGFADGHEKNWGLALPGHPQSVLDTDLCTTLLTELERTSGGKRFLAWNGKFDNLCLIKRYGVRFRLDADVMLAHHMVDEEASHSLKPNSRRHCGAPDYDLTKKEKKNTRLVPIRRLLEYNCGDSAFTRRMDPMFHKRLDSEERRLYERVVMPAARAFVDIEGNGLYVDLKRLNQVSLDTQKELDVTIKELNKVAGREINWNSRDQVAEVLFGDLGLQPTIYTPTGKASTGEEALVDLDHPIRKTIERYRELDKFLSTYAGRPQPDGSFVGGWRELMHGPHLYLGTKIHGTVTGRYSSRLHQIPRDGVIRNCITAPPGWRFWQLDLDQAELRTVAIASRDPEMLRCFKMKEDIHWRTLMAVIQSGGGEYVDMVFETARAVTKRKLDFNEAVQIVYDLGKFDPEFAYKVNADWKEGRKKAKGVNFGFVFDQSPEGFVNYAKLKYGFEPTLQESTTFHSAYFNLYRALSSWHDRQRKLARADGFVRSLVGRKRHLPGIHSEDRQLVGEAERQAINAPIQGFIGDYKAMILIEVHESFPSTHARVVGEHHDALLGWVKIEHEEAILPRILEIANRPRLAREFGLRFPIEMAVSMEVGPWGAGQKYKGASV